MGIYLKNKPKKPIFLFILEKKTINTTLGLQKDFYFPSKLTKLTNIWVE